MEGLSRAEHFQAFVMVFFEHEMTHLEGGYLPEFHQEWTRYVGQKRIAIAAPRNFGKSVYFSIWYPLFVALEQAGKKVMIISATLSFAEKFLKEIRFHLENNEALIAMYGEQKTDLWRQDLLRLKNGSEIMARGAGSQVRGLHPHVVIADDLETDEVALSETMRDDLKQWFWKALINVLDSESQMIVVGTLLHPDSLLADLVQHPRASWTTETYRALKDENTSLWPSRWPVEVLRARRDEVGFAAFEQEYQNNPIPDERRIFKAEDFRYFDVEPKQCVYFTTVDPAIQIDVSKDPDYTAIVTCAVDADKNIYVVEVTRDRLLPSETISEIFRHFETYHAQVVGIETIGFQKVLKYSLEEEAARRNHYPFFKELTHGGVRKRFHI